MANRSVGNLKDRSAWVSLKLIAFFLSCLPIGFVLASAGGALFGAGIIFWIIGVFGSVYSIVRRLWGPRAAKFAVLVLVLILLWELFSGKSRESNHERSDY